MNRISRGGLLVRFVVVPLAPRAPIQFVMPEEYREVQVRQLEAGRTILVAMADSMPRDLYRDRATPAQRDFAGQLYHAANGLVQFSRVVLDAPVPIEPDTVRILNEPGAMRIYLNEVFDFAMGLGTHS